MSNLADNEIQLNIKTGWPLPGAKFEIDPDAYGKAGPLRFLGLADNEVTTRVIKFIAKFAADEANRHLGFHSPNFGDLSVDGITKLLYDFLLGLLPEIIEVHTTYRITFEDDPAGWTGYTCLVSVNEFNACRDLRKAANERFALAAGVM